MAIVHHPILPNGYLNGYYRIKSQTLMGGLQLVRKECPEQNWQIRYTAKEINGKVIKQYFIAEITK